MDHVYRPTEENEPMEEDGVCVRCGAFANSENRLPCDPDNPTVDR